MRHNQGTPSDDTEGIAFHLESTLGIAWGCRRRNVLLRSQLRQLAALAILAKGWRGALLMNIFACATRDERGASSSLYICAAIAVRPSRLCHNTQKWCRLCVNCHLHLTLCAVSLALILLSDLSFTFVLWAAVSSLYSLVRSSQYCNIL